MYDGTLHPPGSGFPSTDGCNSCFCDVDGQVSCTLKACIGDGGSTCSYGGQQYDVGASFPSTDGCNSCGCSATGEVSCTERGCDGLCTLDATYTFGPNGGFVAYVDTATLTPPGVYSYVRTQAGSGLVAPTPQLFCAPALPACRSSNAIDVSDIMGDLSDANVQDALAAKTPPIYGNDARPVDGQVFEVKRSTGGSFLVGYDCSPTSSSCRPIPPGIAKLVADLRALNEQQLADPNCEKLR